MNDPELKPCWQLRDAAIERDVLAFWREGRLLPSVADAAARLKDICLVAYDGARAVGVVEARLRYLEFIRSRIAMVKLVVSPAHRQEELATDMIGVARQILEQWSVDHPEEKLMGIGCIVQSKDLGQKVHQAVWPRSSLALINYTPRGEQMRLSWFKHATVA